MTQPVMVIYMQIRCDIKDKGGGAKYCLDISGLYPLLVHVQSRVKQLLCLYYSQSVRQSVNPYFSRLVKVILQNQHNIWDVCVTDGHLEKQGEVTVVWVLVVGMHIQSINQ